MQLMQLAKLNQQNDQISSNLGEQILKDKQAMIQLQREQNMLMKSYLAGQVNNAIKFSCILDLYDVIQENHQNVPDEQLQQQFQHRHLVRQRGAPFQNQIEEISEQFRIIQNNQDSWVQKILRYLGILKNILVQPISKYIISLMIQKYVTQFVWEKTSYCLAPQLAAGLSSLTFGLFYLKLKDSKKFLHENYIWFFGSSLFIYFNIQQNMKEAANLSIKI
ncbi:hypothetical protein ABPG74_010389 [Tetrahymena malaccensis]